MPTPIRLFAALLLLALGLGNALAQRILLGYTGHKIGVIQILCIAGIRVKYGITWVQTKIAFAILLRAAGWIGGRCLCREAKKAFLAQCKTNVA